MVRWEAHLFDAVVSGKVKGQDCCPPHWLSTGLRRSSSTCLATSMVSSRSKSPSASSMESLLPQCRCYIKQQQHAGGCTCTHSYHHYPIMGGWNCAFLSPCCESSLWLHLPQRPHSSHLHRWVYAVGVGVIDGCWGRVIHIGWVPTCRVRISCSKPVKRGGQRKPVNLSPAGVSATALAVFFMPSTMYHYVHCGRPRRWRQGPLTNKPNAKHEWRTSSLGNLGLL